MKDKRPASFRSFTAILKLVVYMLVFGTCSVLVNKRREFAVDSVPGIRNFPASNLLQCDMFLFWYFTVSLCAYMHTQPLRHLIA